MDPVVAAQKARTLLRLWLCHLAALARRQVTARVELDAGHLDAHHGLVVALAPGVEGPLWDDLQGREVHAQAALTTGCVGRQVEVLRFCRAHRLPVQAWLVAAPAGQGAHMERLARDILELARACGPSRLVVDTHRLDTSQRRRLKGALRRLGCEIAEGKTVPGAFTPDSTLASPAPPMAQAMHPRHGISRTGSPR